jgi:hypothetical protein
MQTVPSNACDAAIGASRFEFNGLAHPGRHTRQHQGPFIVLAFDPCRSRTVRASMLSGWHGFSVRSCGLASSAALGRCQKPVGRTS